MNFLELCQAVMRKGGMSGSLVSVQNQTGEALRVVNWVAEAYRYVLNKHSDWTFLRTDVSFATGASNSTFTAVAAGVAEFGEWCFIDGWRCYSAAVGFMDEQAVLYMPYNRFRQIYGYGSNRLATGRPQVVTEKPDQSLLFWPTPDTSFIVVGEQFKCPADLANNTDTPAFPAKMHQVIVWRALMFYAEFEGDMGLFTSAQSECKRLFAQMESLYLPSFEESGPMV